MPGAGEISTGSPSTSNDEKSTSSLTFTPFPLLAGYEELLETLRARNIVRAEWTVYYYNDKDTSEGGTLSFANGSTTPFDHDTEEDIYEALVYDVSCDGRLSDTSCVFVLDAESGTVERAADVFFDFERQLDDEEEGIEKDDEEYMTVAPLPEAEQDRLKLTE